MDRGEPPLISRNQELMPLNWWQIEGQLGIVM